MTKRYNSVTALTADLTTDKEFKKNLEHSIRRHALSKALFAIRCSKKVSQAEMASRMKCSQGRVSKLEHARDDIVKVKDIAEYASALGLEVSISFANQDRTAVDSVKYHAFKIKEHLDRLGTLAKKDEKLLEGVSRFFGEALVNLVAIVQSSANKLQKRRRRRGELIHISGIPTQHEELDVAQTK